MTILLDTSILVDHLRGHQQARSVLTRAFASGGRVVGSVVTRVEVLAGMRKAEEARTAALLDLIEWIPVDEVIAERAGLIARQYLRSHPGVDSVDFIIAATVEGLPSELWTRNLKHFPMLPSARNPYD